MSFDCNPTVIDHFPMNWGWPGQVLPSMAFTNNRCWGNCCCYRCCCCKKRIHPSINPLLQALKSYQSKIKNPSPKEGFIGIEDKLAARKSMVESFIAVDLF